MNIEKQRGLCYDDSKNLGETKGAGDMAKVFNTAAVCVPQQHYMVNIEGRLKEIKKLVDQGKYFTIHKARQYGKTTILFALSQYLEEDYDIVSIDFQTFDNAKFEDGSVFSIAFASSFLRALKRNKPVMQGDFRDACETLEQSIRVQTPFFSLKELFEELSDICDTANKPIVLMIDEVDSATNNQVFLDFLAQIRAQYIKRFQQPTFQSVILAGVYDVKNLKRKIRPEEEQNYNSPWNIAADFKVDLSFSKEDIVGMLAEYESDYHTGMDMERMASLLLDYTSGYPFLVSRLCQLMDEDVSVKKEYGSKETAWTKAGFYEAVRMILSEKNTLFESLIGKLHEYPKLNAMLRTLLFTGRSFTYGVDGSVIDMAAMFGFVKNENGTVAVANRIFETRLYNYYLSEEEMQQKDIYKASLQERNQFVVDGHLNMKKILEKFVMHFHDIYGNETEKFLEEEGRQYFLLYLRPIINGTGNYYIEARTRDLRRTDIIVDYHGEQFVIEMKIWHGEEYNQRGEKQLMGYLEDYHVKKGYMISFNFNKKKTIGVHEIIIEDKAIIEAVV
ncbi:MAG: AAA-like domain-containing protein [Lachnospiraceae bacterium]